MLIFLVLLRRIKVAPVLLHQDQPQTTEEIGDVNIPGIEIPDQTIEGGSESEMTITVGLLTRLLGAAEQVIAIAIVLAIDPPVMAVAAEAPAGAPALVVAASRILAQRAER
jgi:hypothetical protein